MNIGDLFLRLLIDDSDLEKQVVSRAQRAGDLAGRSMGAQMAAGLSKGATDIGKSLSNLGRNLASTGRGLTSNLTLPLVAAGAAASHFALDFDTTLRRVVGLTDVTQNEIAGIREEILKMAPAVGKGPNELATAFYFVASAGFKAQEAMEVLEVAAKTAAAGLGETQTVAQVLGSVINAYGKENITAARAADILVESVSQGTAEADAFAGVIGRVVPIAAALGVSFDQVGAALAGMTLSGIDADEAATSLRQILVSILKPAAEADEALASMGLNAEGLRQELREKGLLATLRTLEERFKGNEAATAKVFGNVRALAGIQNLLGLSTEQLDSVFGKVANSVGRYGEAFEQTEGPQRAIARSMADLEVTAIELGADVLPLIVDVLKQIATGARAVAKWWKSLDADTRKQIIQWLAWAAIAGPIVLLLGKLATGFSAIFKLVGFLAGAKGVPRLIKNLKMLRLAGLGVLGVVGVLAVLGASEVDAIGNMDDVAKRAQKLGLTWDELRSKGEDLAQQTGQDLPDAIDAVLTAMEEGEAAAGRIGEGGIFGLAMRMLDEQMAHAKAAAGELPTAISAELVDGAFEVGDAADITIAPVAEAILKAKQDVADAANELLHTLATVLSSNPQELQDAAQSVIDDILHPFPDAKHKLQILGILARKDWVVGLTSPDSGDRARTADYLKGLLAEFEALAPGVLASGEGIPPALQAGIDRTLAALTTYLNTTVVGGIKNQFDLADELELMGYAGLAGYVRGLETARLRDLTHELYMGNVAVHTGLPDDLYTEGYDAGASYGEGLAAGGKLAVTAVQRFAGKIKNLMQFTGSPPYTHSAEYGEGAGQSFSDALVAALQRAMPRVAAAVSQIATGMSLTPARAAASVPTAQVYPMAQGGPVGANSVINNNWNLTVNGVQQTFRTRDDFIRALDAVSRFGGGDGRLSVG